MVTSTPVHSLVGSNARLEIPERKGLVYVNFNCV